MSRGGGLVAAYGRRRYAILFYTLLLTVGAAPVLAALHFSTNGLQILLVLSLLTALLGVTGERWRMGLMVLAAVAVGLRAAPTAALGSGVASGALVVALILALLAAASALWFAMRTASVDAEHIYAALSVYLLAGLIFGVVHWTLEQTWPGSLVDTGASGSGAFPLSTAIYYSFITLATLGYGDVVPRTEMARGLAVLEAIGGQLYVAVLIARLVGARLPRSPG
ncbi:MAG TPA: potassium channel family protein [Methylomirabilota bacterium]|nr:potassium channel family protein [Methylomirabilota bacterium]